MFGRKLDPPQRRTPPSLNKPCLQQKAMSELYGRKTVYIAVFLFFCFSLATATAENFQTVLVTRFFAGFFASGREFFCFFVVPF